MIKLVAQINTMDNFGTRAVSQFKSIQAKDQPLLAERWAPGFEPGNIGQAAHTAIMQYMATANVSAVATWEVRVVVR